MCNVLLNSHGMFYSSFKAELYTVLSVKFKTKKVYHRNCFLGKK